MFANRFIRLLASAALPLLAVPVAHAYGEPVTSFQSQSFPGWSCSYSSTLRPDNTLFGQVTVRGANPYQYSIAKFRPDGSIDTSWGDHGVANNPWQGGSMYPLADGSILLSASGGFRRFTPSGTIDMSYGTNGLSDWPFNGIGIASVDVLPDGTVYMLGTQDVSVAPKAVVARLDSHGHFDASFGTNGFVSVSVPAFPHVYAWSVFSDGSIEVASYPDYQPSIQPVLHRSAGADAAGRLVPHSGIAGWIEPTVGLDAAGYVYFVQPVSGTSGSGIRLLRFTPAGAADSAFANAFIPVQGAVVGLTTEFYVQALWHSVDGSWSVVASSDQYTGGWAHINSDGRARVVRFLADGTPDASFAQGAVLAPELRKFNRSLSGDLVSLSSAYGPNCGESRLKGDPPAENTMVEYYAPALDHYFMTLEGPEAVGLDTTLAGNGWKRTGLSFGAWMLSDLPNTKKLCRFYGDLQAGPNSHFYTPEGSECDGLKALADRTPIGQAAWRYEGLVGNVALPQDGACANNLTPVYRLYNNRAMQNDTNHRFTADGVMHAAMEGWADEGVAFYSPS